MRLSTYGKPRVVACGEDFPEHVDLPRGCLSEIIALLDAHGVRPEVRDERFAGTPIKVKFRAELRPLQLEAVSKAIQHEEGILLRTDGFRKDRCRRVLIAKCMASPSSMIWVYKFDANSVHWGGAQHESGPNHWK